jgi:hypothetical protein
VAAEEEPKMVDNLLDFQTKMDVLLEQSFHKNESFVLAMKNASEHFVNSKGNRPGLLLPWASLLG